MGEGIKNARDQLYVDPNCVIDIGAKKGTWTQQCLQVWPDADYILIKPLENLSV